MYTRGGYIDRTEFWAEYGRQDLKRLINSEATGRLVLRDRLLTPGCHVDIGKALGLTAVRRAFGPEAQQAVRLLRAGRPAPRTASASAVAPGEATSTRLDREMFGTSGLESQAGEVWRWRAMRQRRIGARYSGRIFSGITFEVHVHGAEVEYGIETEATPNVSDADGWVRGRPPPGGLRVPAYPGIREGV